MSIYDKAVLRAALNEIDNFAAPREIGAVCRVLSWDVVEFARLGHEGMHRIIEEALQGMNEAEVVGWRSDMDCAPKDRRILLYRPTAPDWARIAGGKYNPHSYASNPRPYWDSDLERTLGIAWCRKNPPTHWQPLPASPTSNDLIPGEKPLAIEFDDKAKLHSNLA